jgi:hypothetical protein
MTEYIAMQGQPRRELEKEHAHGYKLEEVVADLVDNSIDAGANNVWIIFAEETYINKDSFYLIAVDDGSGIDADGISSVMDFGAPRDYDELELGKFGVGMKSSSLSQAKEITLLSKISGGAIELRRLSSQIVYDKDQWVLISELEGNMHTDAISIAKRELANLDSGTCLVLEDMHKLDNRIGSAATKSAYMEKESVHVRDYLALAFDRYIGGVTLTKSDGSIVERQINIFLNGSDEINRVPLLDPFCKAKQDGTVTGTLEHTFELEVSRPGINAMVPVTIWITPKSDDRADYCNFMDDGYDDRMKNAGRDLGISELQGLYIYRNERLINFAGWHNICKHDPGHTCDRWEIHFPPKLDSIFQLDPSKRDVTLPTEILEALNSISRKQIRWHTDDSSTSAHRPRSKKRQAGSDAPRTRSPTPSGPTPSGPTPSGPTPSGPTPSGPTPPGPNLLTSIKVKKLAALPTGSLVISERGSNSVWTVTLNTNHSLYSEFITKIKEL